jgi:hypothetical protein
MTGGEEVPVKPDALAHLADALMEDIVAMPPHQLAIEELADSRRSHELTLRFDDILAEAVALAETRPVTMCGNAIWNLTDAMCEDIAAQPADGPHGVMDEGGGVLAGAFDDILRRDPHLAAAGLTFPRRSGGLSHPASNTKDAKAEHINAVHINAVLAKLVDRLIAPLRSRVAAGAFATVMAVAVVTSAVYEYGTLRHETGRLAESREPVEVGIVGPKQAAFAASSRQFLPPQLDAAADPGEMRVAAAAPPPAMSAPGRDFASRAAAPAAGPGGRAEEGRPHDEQAPRRAAAPERAAAAPPAPVMSDATADDDRRRADKSVAARPAPVAPAQAGKKRVSAAQPPVAVSKPPAPAAAAAAAGGGRPDSDELARARSRSNALYEAAIQGQYEAQAAYGALLLNGAVVPRDVAQGLMWLKIAMDAAPRDAAWIADAYNAAWRQATGDERAAAMALLERRRDGGKPPSESGTRLSR